MPRHLRRRASCRWCTEPSSSKRPYVRASLADVDIDRRTTVEVARLVRVLEPGHSFNLVFLPRELLDHRLPKSFRLGQILVAFGAVGDILWIESCQQLIAVKICLMVRGRDRLDQSKKRLLQLVTKRDDVHAFSPQPVHQIFRVDPVAPFDGSSHNVEVLDRRQWRRSSDLC